MCPSVAKTGPPSTHTTQNTYQYSTGHVFNTCYSNPVLHQLKRHKHYVITQYAYNYLARHRAAELIRRLVLLSFIYAVKLSNSSIFAPKTLSHIQQNNRLILANPLEITRKLERNVATVSPDPTTSRPPHVHVDQAKAGAVKKTWTSCCLEISPKGRSNTT